MNILGLSATERAVGKYAKAAFAKRGEREGEGGESQGERKPHLGERERGHEEEREDFTVKEGRFQGGEGGQARRALLGEVERSIRG